MSKTKIGMKTFKGMSGITAQKCIKIDTHTHTYIQEIASY